MNQTDTILPSDKELQAMFHPSYLTRIRLEARQRASEQYRHHALVDYSLYGFQTAKDFWEALEGLLVPRSLGR